MSQEWMHHLPLPSDTLTMHDCTVTRIETEATADGGRMIWHFPDGVWASADSHGRDYGGLYRTAEACVVFDGMGPSEDVEVAVCLKRRIHGRGKRRMTETWEYLPLADFLSRVNSGEWSLEVNETYTECRCLRISGEIHTKTKRWWREFRMTFTASSACFCWNLIRKDRPW